MTGLRPDQLTGEARNRYDTWRQIGLTEAAALQALIDDGTLRLERFDEVSRNLQGAFGLSEGQANIAVAGRERGVGGARSEWRHDEMLAERGITREQEAEERVRAADRARIGELVAERKALATVLSALPADPQRVVEHYKLHGLAKGLAFVSEAAGAGDDKVLSLRLITAGVGTCGYYPEETLQEAARDRIFPAGLHLYIDHPTMSDEHERPERSVRDLAGVLTTDAVYREGGLFAGAKVFASHRDFIVERAEEIGMSIRAQAVVESGQVGSYVGQIVQRLTKAESVDFVTRAGRGGRIVAVS